ncbi:MAG: hypothetical protein ACRC62_10350, partial [Microcoleus sp.]
NTFTGSPIASCSVLEEFKSDIKDRFSLIGELFDEFEKVVIFLKVEAESLAQAGKIDRANRVFDRIQEYQIVRTNSRKKVDYHIQVEAGIFFDLAEDDTEAFAEILDEVSVAVKTLVMNIKEVESCLQQLYLENGII